MSAQEAIVDRVRKLLALATSDNVHEAAAAAVRAQALITEHRLQDWVLCDDPAVDPIVDARDEPLETSRRLRRWKTALASTLAGLNGCVAYTLVFGRERSLILVGRRRDREMVHALYDGLVKQIEWLSATHGAGQSKKWHESFRVGAVDRIAERLSAETVPDRLAPSHALVVAGPAMRAHQAALERFVGERLRLTSGRRLTVLRTAWRSGQEASEGLALPFLGL